MATLIRCWLRAKTRDQAQITSDATGLSANTVTTQETWGLQFDGWVSPTDAYSLGVAGDGSGNKIPKVGNVYDGLFCNRAQPMRATSSPYVFDIIVDKSNQQQGNSTTYNVSLQIGSAATEEPADQDRLGLPLVNAAGDLLPQRPNNTIVDDVITISYTTKNVPNFIGKQIKSKTNQDPVQFQICGIRMSFAKNQMKCMDASVKVNKITNGVSGEALQTSYTYDCELVFQIRYPKWRWRTPNEGWLGFDSIQTYGTFAADPYGEITDESLPNRKPASKPTPMDLDGTALDQDQEILMIPDDFIGKTVDNSGRDWPEDGSFEIDDQAMIAFLFVGLNDSEQVLPVPPG